MLHKSLQIKRFPPAKLRFRGCFWGAGGGPRDLLDQFDYRLQLKDVAGEGERTAAVAAVNHRLDQLLAECRALEHRGAGLGGSLLPAAPAGPPRRHPAAPHQLQCLHALRVHGKLPPAAERVRRAGHRATAGRGGPRARAVQGQLRASRVVPLLPGRTAARDRLHAQQPGAGLRGLQLRPQESRAQAAHPAPHPPRGPLRAARRVEAAAAPAGTGGQVRNDGRGARVGGDGRGDVLPDRPDRRAVRTVRAARRAVITYIGVSLNKEYRMNLDIFQSTKNWSYSGDDLAAQAALAALTAHARKNLPKGFFDRNAPLSLEYMRGSELYGHLRTLPKGALHNVLLDCCDDLLFYRDVVAHDPTVYLTPDLRSFRIASPAQAAAQGWVGMAQARGRFVREEEFVEAIAGVALMTEGEIRQVCREEVAAWSLIARKLSNSATLLTASHIFPRFIRHVLRKFIANGYSRVEFRAELPRLSRYDSQGNFVEKLPHAAFAQLFDEALAEVALEHPAFSAGFIFCLRKSISASELESAVERICALRWERAVGVDFLQEDGKYGSIEEGNAVVDAVLARHPSVRLRKAYHAGESRDFKSRNIEEAVGAGSVRIGHGLNVMQRIEFLPYCRFLCFEKCPLANLLLGHTGDPRESSAPILLGLGYAVSISVGDAGKLGAEDCTPDYFVSLVSYDWTLKHLKLVALHSINHSLQAEGERAALLKDFEQRWAAWADRFLAGAHQPTASRPRELDFFTTTSNWQFSAQDEEATRRFEAMRLREISHLPKSYFGKSTMAHLEHMRSTEMYKILKTVPKGVLHHHHLDCNEDEDFYLNIVMADPNVYLAADRKSFKIGPRAQAEREKWVSWAQLRAEVPNEKRRVRLVSNLTMLSKEELAVVAGEQHDFWVLFEQKISNFFPIVFALHLFKQYVRHSLLKFVANGYERVEFRALLCQLSEYDAEGNFVKLHDEGEYMRAFDEVYEAVVREHPHFSAGFIFFGLKALSEEENFKLLDKACSYNWPRQVGIDFVQQEDPFGSMEPYVRVGDRIVRKYAHMHLKKAYHAGETKDHLNNNVELAVRSGAVRIGHGLNIFKRIDYLPQCRHVCFELNPISNLLTGGMADIRMSPAPLLLGLGYAVSISSDDPGKFGYEDTTVDYFAAAVCFNWTLKHLKLVAYHSINHAIVTEGERVRILQGFNLHWEQWVAAYLQSEQQEDGAQLTHARNGKQNMRLLAARINSFERT